MGMNTLEINPFDLQMSEEEEHEDEEEEPLETSGLEEEEENISDVLELEDEEIVQEHKNLGNRGSQQAFGENQEF